MGRIVVGLLILIGILSIGYFAWAASSRGRFYDLYTKKLDVWVTNGGDTKVLQSQVVETCGKLVLTQAGSIEQMQLMTLYRDEFDFRVDVCTKLTVNRVYKQPEFEKPDFVSIICDDPHPYHELFRKLCRKSGLR